MRNDGAWSWTALGSNGEVLQIGSQCPMADLLKAAMLEVSPPSSLRRSAVTSTLPRQGKPTVPQRSDSGVLHLPDPAVPGLLHRPFLADRRVLGADIRAALLERAELADGTVHPYALGVYHFTVGGKAAYGHAGSVDGYRSQLLYVPEDGLGFACLANQTRIGPLTLVNRAAGGERYRARNRLHGR
ncbi:hypothetical protein OIC43_09075 [Streptomyces sp. NBC_00825]|uniref:hypothetical protein n=1 Tax=unclassified Streptomyces TaxID=2593676 RepID=UPI002ED68943|nr:hypothetical protein OG832_34625 [Streptomyces sp. NBC_00826]WTH89184.1 hypothetical protein OIC43_09075 [Streptomyces sp. NBC_00825]WTH97908.1 hypothetical protein OHA23_09060 [Streptomyces sp. NBC_00822]